MARGIANQIVSVTSDKLPLPRLYSVRDVCAIFNRSPRTIRTWCQSGRLRPVYVGRSVFFRAKDIEELLAQDPTTEPYDFAG